MAVQKIKLSDSNGTAPHPALHAGPPLHRTPLHRPSGQTPGESDSSTRMRAMSRKAHGITTEERDARRLRVLDFLQQVRVATRRDIDQVAGYRPGVPHDYVLETLYGHRLIDRIPDLDGPQSLYTLTRRGDQAATAPSGLAPLDAATWENASQQEHVLGVARFASLLLSPTPVQSEPWPGAARACTALAQGRYVLLGEAMINARYAESYGRRSYPPQEALRALYAAPEPCGTERSLLLAQAGWYEIPPYLHSETGDDAPISVVDDQGTPITDGTQTIMARHPADAVLAPRSMARGQAIALELERYCKPASSYEKTMLHYGSAYGRARFGLVVWACASGQIRDAVLRAAERTGTSRMVRAFTYTTGRNGSFLRGLQFETAR